MNSGGGPRSSAGVNTTTSHQKISTSRGLLLAGAVIALGLLASPALRASERWETLEAIHWLENPRDSAQPGPCGELGAYQFREATWHKYTTVPFARAVERPVSDAVAIRHYEWLKQGLVQHGLAPSAYNIALAWNAGLCATLNGRTSATSRFYATRVANLVEYAGKPAATEPSIAPSVEKSTVPATATTAL